MPSGLYAYFGVKRTKSRLGNKPNSYLHKIVRNLNVDNWRHERRAERIAEHAELIEHHVRIGLSKTQSA